MSPPKTEATQAKGAWRPSADHDRAPFIARERILADEGYGPLLQRDYWGRLKDCSLKASEFGALLARCLPELVPPSLATFRLECERPAEVGDTLAISIRFLGRCRVEVLHRDANSLTLGTLVGHPEAGRITFGAYRHVKGEVIFHIRSRARTSSPLHYAGFLAMGTSMQSNTWTGLIERVASTFGAGVAGRIHEDTTEHEDEDRAAQDGPTFLARGD